ncbi:sensor histidine kinase [Methanobacterium oryzae]|uniref:sensor histidine kinase n=1 Tax=Methanobacterium oryzae TaxID=69540 RepID=UPI003D1F626B
MEDHNGQFKEIFEKSPIGTLFYDKKGKLLNMNQSSMSISDIPSINVSNKVNFNDPLELKVKKRISELDKLIEELKRSNEELEQFAYVASHDLQEPLRAIISFTQLLERRYKGQLDSDADEFMDYIIDAAERMQQLINGLLQYSRVTTQGNKFQPVNINNVVNDVLFNLRTSIEENNAEITVDKLPTVTIDKLQLLQLFQNIIGNAIKFKKPDESPKIHISANKDEERNEYVFSVVDNGIGIEPQYNERIFVIFQRLHTQDVYKGTGIGLSIAKRIIERCGGCIWVESSFGKGSTFYFTLPIWNK